MRWTERPFNGRAALHLSHDRAVWLIIRTQDYNQGIARIEQAGVIRPRRQACGWFTEMHALLAS